ncbi:MAG: LacI family transcriptional regulator [Phycisphaerae bacterium]|nr:LacI family transcriptional regulator [Phycisphaerae bacterium]
MAFLKDIAAAAGVSIRTVSRVLKQSGYVNEATRTKVMAAAKQLDYRPSLAARALKTGKSFEVTAIIGSVDELHMEKIAGLEQALRAAGYSVHIFFSTTPADRQDAGDVLDAVLQRQPAAIIIFPNSLLPVKKVKARLAETNTPYVFLDTGHAGTNTVNIDRQQGVYEAVKYLAAHGRRHIAYMGSPNNNTRLAGYERAIKELCREPIILATAGNTQQDQYEVGRKNIETFLAANPRPDAVQVFSDVMAMGFLAALHEHGIAVPDDVAVVGFDNRRVAALAWPRLTTVMQPNRELGTVAAEILLSKIAGRKPPADDWYRILSTKLVQRDSA